MASRAHQSLTLDLGPLSAVVEKRVSSGEYASASEVVMEGLRALEREEQAVEDFLSENREVLRRKIAKALADPRPSISQDEVFARLRTRIAELKAR